MEKEIELYPLLVFPPISFFSKIKNQKIIQLSLGERYRKQSLRTRFEIAGSNKVQVLSLPLNHPGNRACMVDISLNYQENRNIKHLSSLQTCYRKAAFFEFYFPYFEHLFTSKYHLLAEFNLEALHIIKRCLKLDIQFEINTEAIPSLTFDFKSTSKPYFQVFEERNGFIENLSILDLIFNEGPNAMDYI